MCIFRQQKHAQYWFKETYARYHDILQKDWTFCALLQKTDKVMQQHGS